MDILCVQLESVWEDKPASISRVRALLARAEVPAGGLVVLPEMFSTGYSMDVEAVAEGDERVAEGFLAEVARGYRTAVVGGVVTRAADGRGRNEAVVVGADGREVGRYCKMHPFSYAGEDRHYAAGDGVCVVEVGGARVAPFVCYDLRFPEVFRAAVRLGAEVFVVIANWPEGRQSHWRVLLRARAIENQACVVGVNRAGRDPNVAYAGGSMVVDPRGEVVAEAGREECTLRGRLDLEALRAYRREFPALADMRPREELW